jgi:methionyl-tRNA formyltransferase
MHPLRTIYFGTPIFAVAPLEILLQDKRYQIIAVVSQQDKPVGRQQIRTKSPVVLLAEEREIPVYTPSTVKTEETVLWVQNQRPDICIVVAYGKIIPQKILSIPPYGFINVHGSLLPKYRGASPIQYALWQGEKETGITIMQMNEKMDEGDMIMQKSIPIDPHDTYTTLSEKLSCLGAEMLGDTVEKYVQNKILPVPQNHAQATYCSLITKEMGHIEWATETAIEIERKLRAFTPWPGIYTYLAGKRLKILQAHVEHQHALLPAGSLVEKKRIQTREGMLVPTLVQPEGKKPMSFEDFIRGQQGKTIVFS